MKRLPKSQGIGYPILFKINLKMRLAILCFFLTLMGIQAKTSFAQKTITLNVKEATVFSLLEDIETHSDYRFVYKVNDIDLIRTVDLKAKEEKIPEVLDKIFKETSVTYTILGTQIFLGRQISTMPESSLVVPNSYQQQTEITGVVTDEKGVPIPSVNITVNGTSRGTSTDFDGNYSIQVEKGETLTFSSVGFLEKNITVDGDTVIDVIMEESASTLDEVMVVAYGVTKKSSFTGSAKAIQSADIQTPTASFDKGLIGKVAGVQVVSSSGQPGSSTSFRIRGSGSLTGSNEPLYVVDGAPINSYDGDEYSQIASNSSSSGNILSSINTNDIESITILKDASAAALYGSRAANGVVVITTKGGKQGKMKVNFNTSLSWSTLGNGYNMMNSEQYYRQFYEAYRERGSSIEDANERTQGVITNNPFNDPLPMDDNGLKSGVKTLTNTIWADEVFRTAFSENYNLSVNGGNEEADYYMSIGYSNMEGIAPNSNLERYTGRIKLNATPTPWLKTGMNVNFSNYTQKTTVAGVAGASPLNNALKIPNGVPIYVLDENGEPILDENGEKEFNYINPVNVDFNPLSTPQLDDNESEFYNILPSFYAEIRILKDLRYRTNFAAEYLSSEEYRYWNKFHGDGPAYGGRLDMYRHTNLSYTFTNTLNYSHVFSEDHSIDVLGGMEFWRNNYKTLYAGGQSLLGDMKELAGASMFFSSSSDIEKERLISYFGRVEYSFADKYNLSGSIRTDGSSKFGSDNRFGTFWSAGASWSLDKEPFMRKLDFVNGLDLRASYGTSGNKNGLGRYASLGLWTASSAYLYGSNLGVYHAQLLNPSLKWEKQAMLNIGLNFSLFNNRLYGEFDYFTKTSDDLLYDFPLALSNGFENTTLNAAKVQNSGFEFDFGARLIEGKDFGWEIGLNGAIIRDKIKDLHGDNNVQISDGQKIWSIGGSQYEFYMPSWAGVDPQTGDPLWYKTDDNGNRTTTNVYNEAPYEKQGRATPKMYGGVHNRFNYRNFDLSVQINYNIGGKIYDGLYRTIMHDGSTPGTNLHKDGVNSWRTSGQNTNTPKFVVNNSSNSNGLSSRYLYNATHLDLKNITIGYNLPRHSDPLLNVFSSGRIYFSLDNVYTWFSDKGYKGYNDIDIFGVGGYRETPVIPIPKTYTLGINLTF